jgi:hypothetical protein
MYPRGFRPHFMAKRSAPGTAYDRPTSVWEIYESSSWFNSFTSQVFYFFFFRCAVVKPGVERLTIMLIMVVIVMALVHAQVLLPGTAQQQLHKSGHQLGGCRVCV